MTDHSDLIERLARESDPQTIAKLICDALSSQSLSLSEAREETERLKGLVVGIREPDPATATPYGIIDPDYARVFTVARCIAWSEGYALAIHGSFTRDLDLLAVPWADHACDPEHLVQRIADASSLKAIDKEPGQNPHGRIAWTLMFPEFGDPRFVDLSVMPRGKTVEPAPKAADDLLKAIEAWEASYLESVWRDQVQPARERLAALIDLACPHSALENGPAVLADATSNPPLSDLSSLRKGAEVSGWRPINSAPEDEWLLVATTGGWVGEAMVLGGVWKWATDNVFHSDIVPQKWMPLPAHPDAVVETPACLTPAEQKQQAARCACRGADDYCPCQNTPDATTIRIRSALVSGSREDGDG